MAVEFKFEAQLKQEYLIPTSFTTTPVLIFLLTIAIHQQN